MQENLQGRGCSCRSRLTAMRIDLQGASIGMFKSVVRKAASKLFYDLFDHSLFPWMRQQRRSFGPVGMLRSGGAIGRMAHRKESWGTRREHISGRITKGGDSWTSKYCIAVSETTSRRPSVWRKSCVKHFQQKQNW